MGSVVEQGGRARDSPAHVAVGQADDADAETLPRWSDGELEDLEIPPTQVDLGETVEQRGLKRLGHFDAEALELAASDELGNQALSSNGDGLAGQAEAVVASEGVPSPATLKRQRQIDVHRANSYAWHQKWISKGVLRNAPAENNEPASEAASDPVNLGDVPDVPGSFESLQAAQNWFIKDWTSKSPMPKSNTRRALAIKAWMESPLRANMLAGRAGIQT